MTNVILTGISHLYKHPGKAEIVTSSREGDCRRLMRRYSDNSISMKCPAENQQHSVRPRAESDAMGKPTKKPTKLVPLGDLQ